MFDFYNFHHKMNINNNNKFDAHDFTKKKKLNQNQTNKIIILNYTKIIKQNSIGYFDFQN